MQNLTINRFSTNIYREWGVVKRLRISMWETQRYYSGMPGGRMLNDGLIRDASVNTKNPRLYNADANEPTFDFFHTNEPQLAKDQLKIEQKAYGISFRISDQKALDAATIHHQTHVEVDHVERFLAPFWIGHIQLSGIFEGSIYTVDPEASFSNQYHWKDTGQYRFNFPLPDHVPFNQVAASYSVPPMMVEACLTGDHVPSMLISRHELLEEVQQMKCPPKILPFDRSTTTALTYMRAGITQQVLDNLLYNELRKHHSFTSHSLHHSALFHDAVSIRPVFLPLFKLKVRTQSNEFPVTTWVCGATGHVSGAVVHQHSTSQAKIAALGGISTLLTTLPIVEPTAALVFAVAGAVGACQISSASKRREAARAASMEEAEGYLTAELCEETDSQGLKWTVETEETAEYIFREELRAKARKRAEFEQRVQEETMQDEAIKRGSTRFHGRRSRRVRPSGLFDDEDLGVHEDDEIYDPLGYYEVLGLNEEARRKATSKDIAQAFREAARKNHPDTLGPAAGTKADRAKEAMQKIVEAYNILRDPKLRAEYDSGALTLTQRTS